MVDAVSEVCSRFITSYFFFFFKQKTAYEMRISDWSSDVCSSDLAMSAPASASASAMPWPIPVLAPVTIATRFERSKGLVIALTPTGRCRGRRSEEHTSELQSLMRISYAVFCLKQKKKKKTQLST